MYQSNTNMNHNFDDFILIDPSTAEARARQQHFEMEERRLEMFGPESFASPTPTRITSSSIPSSPPSVSRHRKKLRRCLFTDKNGCIDAKFLIPCLDPELQKTCPGKNNPILGFKLQPRKALPPLYSTFSQTLDTDFAHSSPLVNQLAQISPRSALDSSFIGGKANIVTRRHSLNDSRCATKINRRNSGSHALAA